MNIFHLSNDPKECARWHSDRHVSKMFMEAVQILCTAVRPYAEDKAPEIAAKLYKPTHANHGCVKWATSQMNFRYTLRLARALYEQKIRRFGGSHKSHQQLPLLSQLRDLLPMWGDRTPYRAFGPFLDMCSHPDVTTAYRIYYVNAKEHLLAYAKGVPEPKWITSGEYKIPWTARRDKKGDIVEIHYDPKYQWWIR